jgi:pyruvate-ferredoxin/flavodoxin oxidoreductase
VYVASVCLSNQTQLLQALVEADKHDGPSFVVCYAPCINQGVRSVLKYHAAIVCFDISLIFNGDFFVYFRPEGLNDMFDECKFAVDSGYWPLYRYNPALLIEGKNP